MSQRDYICGNCYLIYSGEWPWSADVGRRPCPACGDKHSVATDTFGCVYWEEAKIKEFGDDFCRRSYWWKPEWCSQSLLEECRRKGWGEGAPLGDRYAEVYLDFVI